MFSPSFYLTTARGLTLARIAATPVFLFLMVRTDREESWRWSASLLLLYSFIVLSDILDGRLARKAGAPSSLW
ncbi:MAG: CDP-alcohol phosphatidyltransferase family protein, partial [Candidatus Methylomirabilia bacterium]